MKYISSRIVFYSVIYVLIILLIFFVQFKKGVSYRYKNEHFEASCRVFTNEQKQKEVLLPVRISSNGLLIFITAEDPIKFKMKDGKIQSSKILSYKQEDKSFSLILSDGVVLSFATNDKHLPIKQLTLQSLSITCQLSNKVEEVYVPYKLTQRARIERQGDALLVQYKGRSFSFSKEQAGLLASKDEKPFIAFSKSSSSLYWQEKIQEDENEIDNVLSLPLASRETYQKNFSQFREHLFLTLEKSIKEERANEDIVVAVFSEYIRKNSYQKALSLYPASVLPKNTRNLRIAHFYGNLIESYEREERQNEQLIALISARLSKHDANDSESSTSTEGISYTVDTQTSIFAHSIWQRRNLFTFLFNRERYDLISYLFDVAWNEVSKEGEVSLYELANILQFCMEYRTKRRGEKDCDALQKKCEMLIYRHLFVINDKLYISVTKDEIDTFATFHLANILIRYAEMHANTSFQKIGYLLFNSLYSFTDKPSSFPATFRVQKEGKKKGLMARDAKIILAESLHQIFFADSQFVSHEVKLHPPNDSPNEEPLFASTIANDVKIRKINNKVFLEFYFQKGALHYAVVEGIEPFTNVRIYETLGYKTDTRFEKYDVAGYVYDKEKKRLYLKVDNRSEKEVIELIY